MDTYLDFESINTIFYGIFGFILALFSAWSWQLLPHRLVHLFDTDRRAQLVVLFLLFAFTLQYFNPEHNSLQIIIHAVVMFFFYLLMTKQSLPNFILTMLGLISSALFSNNIKYLNKKVEMNATDKKKTGAEHNQNDKDENKDIQSKIKYATKLRNASILFTLGTIFVGVSFYFAKQYNDHYKKGERLSLFILKFLLEGGSNQRKNTGYVIR